MVGRGHMLMQTQTINMYMPLLGLLNEILFRPIMFTAETGGLISMILAAECTVRHIEILNK